MFFTENCQIFNTQELVRKAASRITDALSYVFVCGYGSTSVKDVRNVASFFYVKKQSRKGKTKNINKH